MKGAMIEAARTTSAKQEAVERDPRWHAVLCRDPAAAGGFVFAVETTGIFCRPSCPARRPKPHNVRFFATCAEAEAAGFRACLRCRPGAAADADPHGSLIAEACRWIEQREAPPTLDELARRSGLSPFHLHRVFKAGTGVTPRAYFAACRARRVRDSLDVGSPSVTSAIYDAGFGSASRFYATSDAMLGMTPTAYRQGGAGQDIRYAVTPSSLGALLVAASRKGVCAVTLGDDPEALVHALIGRFPQARLDGHDPDFQALVATVAGLVERPAQSVDLPLDVQGTAFQERVWQALREIPTGATRSYSEIADRIGAPRAVRAVAQACGANPVAVAIPCHRVVRRDGDLSGYRWGVERKRALLAAEAGGGPAPVRTGSTGSRRRNGRRSPAS